MFKQFFAFKKFLSLIFLFALAVHPLFAQEASKGTQELEPQVIKVYFFILVFAIIISRLVDYIKIVFQWLWPKIKLLSKIGDAVWKAVKTNLDRLKLEYDETKIRNLLNKISVDIVLHLLAFSLGIIFCLVFKLEVISALKISIESETLKYILSGLLAGAGIGPIHSVFRMTGERRKIKELKNAVSGK